MASIPTNIECDKDGYIEKQCPNKECKSVFKIYKDDLKQKTDNNKLYCPLCGHTDNINNWFTDNQLLQFANIANQYTKKISEDSKLANDIDSILKDIDRNIKDIQECYINVQCNKCKARYKVNENSYFCPCCNEYEIVKVFLNQINVLEANVNMIDLLVASIAEGIRFTIKRNILENAIIQIVSYFQSYAYKKYLSIVKEEDSSEINVNTFQRIKDGSNCFKKSMGKEYNDFLTNDDYEKMCLFFQRRHILQHNNGIVDDRYLKNSNDSDYKLGQRIIVKKEDVLEFLNIIRKLYNGLESIEG